MTVEYQPRPAALKYSIGKLDDSLIHDAADLLTTALHPACGKAVLLERQYGPDSGRLPLQSIAATTDGVLIGVACFNLHTYEPDNASLRFLAVDKDYRRLHRIGSSLLGFVERSAAEQSVGTMTVLATKESMSFYLQRGYQPKQLARLRLAKLLK